MSGANDNTARSFCTLLVLILSVLHALLSQTVLAQLSQSAAPTALSKKTPSTDGITPVTSTVRRGPVTAQASLSARTVRIGQSVRLELNVSAPSGVELLMPTFGEALGRFTILDFAPATTIEASGKVRATQRYELLMERSGDHRIAPILVEFVDRRSGAKAAPQGEDAYELLTEPLLLTVLKLTDDEAKQALVPPLTALPKRRGEVVQGTSLRLNSPARK